MTNLLTRHQGPEVSSQQEIDGHLSINPATANRIFGCQILARDAASPMPVRFTGTQRAQPRDTRTPWQLQVFATPGTHLRTFVSDDHEACAYVWGEPSHPEVSRPNVAEWCVDIVARRQFDRFRELIGTFVVIVDQPREQRVTFVSDILGIRPLFVGRCDGRLVFGSDVWAMHEAGATSGELDYDALSSWIAYGYSCTGGSLFADLRRLPAGAALVIDKGDAKEFSYTAFQQRPAVSTSQAADEMHEIVSSSVRTLVKAQPPMSLPLSGGYDSRYLLAAALEAKAPVERIVNVNFTAEEAEVSHRIADILHVPLEDFPVKTSVWDLYDDVHHFMADGLPISKFVTYCVAERYPGMPMINGFLGGIIIRGFDDAFDGKHEADWTEDPAIVLQRNFRLSPFEIFRPDISERIQLRSREALRGLIAKGAPTGKIVDWNILYHRQRYLASNNYLQHIGLTEAIIPFYSWSLIRYKMEHPYSVFQDAVYDTIFQRYFPSLAGIPHSDDLRRQRLRDRGNNLAARVQQWKRSRPRVAKCTARWARELLPSLGRKDTLPLLNKQRCVLVSLLATSTLSSHLSKRVAHVVDSTLLTLRRLHVLERRIKDAKLDLDWNRL